MNSVIDSLTLACLALAFFGFLYTKIRNHFNDIDFWAYWDKHKFNFPLKYKGRTIWYGRTVATTLAVFAKWQNEIYVLANLRGKGCPDYNGYWNLICGYLEFADLVNTDVKINAPLFGTGEYNCYKEALEETGVILPINQIHFHSVNTSPLQNKQNVSLRYYAILDDIDVENYKFDFSNSEQDEVEDAKWINIKDIKEYKWAFNHLELINEMLTSIKL